MPEEIIRSYLVNPFLYSDRSFCCRCGGYFSKNELFWTETGQSLLEYDQELKDKYIQEHGAPPPPTEV